MKLPPELEGLEHPAAYPHPVREIEVVETHISWIILTGDFSYKIKRPVRFSFVDATRLQQRRELCREEVRLNRRLAPEIYLDVWPITRNAAKARIGATGKPVEYAVRMRQFDRGGELDKLVAEDALKPEELAAFGTGLAEWHNRLSPLHDAWIFDDPDTLEDLIVTNARECATIMSANGHAARVNALIQPLEDYAISQRLALVSRVQADTFRECHGDLHLSNLVRLGNHIVAFDGLEFERRFRCIDVADEVAFLYADLEAARRPDLAHHFLNAYLARSGDFGLCCVLNLYVAHRALVMAKTSALHHNTAGSTPNPETITIDRYLATAEAALRRPRPLCVVMCGLSGSGKTWLASRLAPRLQAVHVRADLERKRAVGLELIGLSNSPGNASLYDARHTRQTYDTLEQCGRDALLGRCNVILDATFLRRAQRAQMRVLARECDANLVILRCTATNDTLQRRLSTRSKARTDASEAGVGVLEGQRARMDEPSPDEGTSVIDVNTENPQALETAIAALADLFSK